MKSMNFFAVVLIILVGFSAQAQQTDKETTAPNTEKSVTLTVVPATPATPSLAEPVIPVLTKAQTESRKIYTVISDHYHVESYISQDDANLLSQELESRFAVYNQLFRFVPNGTKTTLRVTAFDSKEAYDSYISAKLTGSHPDGAVYLHYNQENLRELLINRNTEAEALLLPNQAFIQYLRAFVSYPPTWFNKGFTLYYYTLNYDPVRAASDTSTPGPLVFEENLTLLESVRGMVNSMPSLKTLFLDGSPSAELSWALISFFLKSGNADYLRTLTECFMILNKTASTQENTEKVLERMVQYTDWDAFERDFKVYINSRKTFNELIAEGLVAYGEQDLIRAKNAFAAARDQQPAHYVPYYYLGLLAYDAKEFDTARDYYETSLNKSGGTDTAMIALALGFNMAAAGHNSEAIAWLQKAAAIDPDNYTMRVNDLIRRLQ
ncbi:MAG: hypothetical protein LBB43_06105 [Spirochaetaceae bacterium]|jgi:tetratricopeptide (TPR) repeat protein|nr:hypothetical protein [Spirochaetaceae bacterium]